MLLNYWRFYLRLPVSTSSRSRFKTRSVEKKAAAYAAAYDGDERSRTGAVLPRFGSESARLQPGFPQVHLQGDQGEGAEPRPGPERRYERHARDSGGGRREVAGRRTARTIPAFNRTRWRRPRRDSARARTSSASFVRSYRTATNGAPLAAIFVSPDRKDITPNSTGRPRSRRSLAQGDRRMRSMRRSTSCAAVSTTFGVTQPNYPALAQLEPYSGRAAGREGAGARAQVAPRFGFARILDDLQRRRDRADADACRPGGKNNISRTRSLPSRRPVAVAEAADSTADGGLIAEVATAETETAAEATGSYYGPATRTRCWRC